MKYDLAESEKEIEEEKHLNQIENSIRENGQCVCRGREYGKNGKSDHIEMEIKRGKREGRKEG